MRWLTFSLCAIFVLTVQSTIAPRLELFGARPDWVLVIVVFFALYARAPDAVVGAWVLGVGADLMSLERLGVLSSSYLLIALLVSSVREYFFRYRSPTQFVVTLVVGLLMRGAWCIYRWVLYGVSQSVLIDVGVDCLLTSAYTAAWAPLVHGVFLSVPGLWGIGRPRYTYAGLKRTREVRV